MELDHNGRVTLKTPEGALARFHVTIDQGEPSRFHVSEDVVAGEYLLRDRTHASYIDFFDGLARGLKLRSPRARTPPEARPDQHALTPVLTRPVAPEILYGYGDPCVVRVGEADYRLLVTSNDAPNAFPILSSTDLQSWRLTGFVFPEGLAPPWALTGPGISDFWAPELHKVGSEWWVCFSARAEDKTMAIGIARGRTLDGPFVPDEAPLVRGDVIDAHILIDEGGAPWLIWKKDDNDIWPSLLVTFLYETPALSAQLFPSEKDKRTIALAITLWPWARRLDPMERFFVLQTVIEAVAEDVAGFLARLQRLSARPEDIAKIHRIAAALRTRVYAQRLSEDGRGLEGEATVILQNDLPWEGHLIEGVWVTRESGRFYLLYAGNDFSTGYYGIGAAVADRPTGPYRKHDEIFLGSTGEWWGPGHPSVATLPNGRRQLFLHAFVAGSGGYKQFRALLSAPIEFASGQISIGHSDLGGHSQA